MALKDSIKQLGRFIGVLQPGTQQPAYDPYGYPVDPNGGYAGGYPGGQYDPGQYDGSAYGGAPQWNQGYGGAPMQPPQRGQQPYYGEDEYAPQPQAPQRPMSAGQGQYSPQPVNVFGNNQRSKHPPNNVVPLTRPEDGGSVRANKHSEIIICVRGLDDCQEIINALLESKSVFINMEPMDDAVAQRVIDMLCGASFALRGTMAKISHRAYLLAPHTVDVVNSQAPGSGSSFRSEFSSLRR